MNPRLKDVLIALEDAQILIERLLSTLQGLDAAYRLPPFDGSPRGSLSKDINYFISRFPKWVDEPIVILVKCAITQPVDDESVWRAVYELVHEVSIPPGTPPQEKILSTTLPRGLREDWDREYFPDSLDALR